jgi:NADH dehydrogenase
LDRATRLTDLKEREKMLTFVIAGAGPTGVELSGILSEMKSSILKKDYPELNENETIKVYLVDGQSSVLNVMSKKTQDYTYKKLQELGVEIRLNCLVKDFNNDIVELSDGSIIESRNLIWAAGVSAKTFPGFETTCFGRGKRMKTNAFNLVENYENIYAIGDCALVSDDVNYPEGHPQLAQPAIQQARNLAKNLTKERNLWKKFTYQNKGSLAIIGRNKAVFDLPNDKFFIKGFLAWLIWLFVHIMGLVNFKNRLRTFVNWVGYYLYKDQYFRMIIKPNEKVKID